MNSDTVPSDIILFLSTLAGIAGAVLAGLLGWLESRSREQERHVARSRSKLRDAQEAPDAPVDLSAREALARVDRL